MFKKYQLKSFPSNNFPQDLSCFDLIELPLDSLTIKEGEVILKLFWISLDPILRTWISGAKSYLNPVGPGSSVPGFGVAKVHKILKSKEKKTNLGEGDWIVGMLEWS